MFIGSSSSSSGSIEFEIPLLKWSECDTIGKKIGYIAGQTINVIVSNTSKIVKKIGNIASRTINATVSTTSKLTDKVVKILHLDEISRFAFTKINQGIARIGQGLQNIANNIFTETFYQRVSNAARFFTNCRNSTLKAFKTVADWTIVPLYNHVLLPLGKQISKVFNAISKNCNSKNKTVLKQAKTAPKPVNSRCCKLYTQVLNHIIAPVCRLIEDVKRGIFNWTIVPICNHIIAPVCRHIIAPACRHIQDILHGILSGCSAPKDKEESLNKDEEELKKEKV